MKTVDFIREFDTAGNRYLKNLTARLNVDGHWEGRLSGSALATATAVTALHYADAEQNQTQIHEGLRWLADHANPDGGWGDTVRSLSNISTTVLCWAAFGLGCEPAFETVVSGAEVWLADHAGGTEPSRLAQALLDRYQSDRSFSVPILTMLALCGRLGPQEKAWLLVKRLPFELAALPRRFFKWLKLPVVSYALPALIAMGQAIHYHRVGGNPLTGLLRRLTRARTLRILSEIQPENGGFLEAVPLTAFVTMSLASMGLTAHPVVLKGAGFLRAGRRSDGSWPIDTHLATWVTTLSVNALRGDLDLLDDLQLEKIKTWLLDQQYRRVHLYTLANPGGWSWTPLPGGVPDADDTSGALIALANLAGENSGAELKTSARAGLDWLVQLQNRDGGMPTFCKGWGSLPFDRSCADITAHALQAMAVWEKRGLAHPRRRTAIKRGLAYLERNQRGDGSWLPLWFGNQHQETQQNPVYGTARVLMGLQSSFESGSISGAMIRRGRAWLRQHQDPSGGWGAEGGLPCSIEETALALTALVAGLPSRLSENPRHRNEAAAARRGFTWLLANLPADPTLQASPIGFYFANLWYYEDLYPLIFTVSAFGEARAKRVWFQENP